MIGEDYEFEYIDLTQELLIKYSMPIVYIMLKNGQYATTKVLSKILSNFNRNTIMTLINKLRDIVSNDIDLNAINYYVMKGEE